VLVWVRRSGAGRIEGAPPAPPRTFGEKDQAPRPSIDAKPPATPGSLRAPPATVDPRLGPSSAWPGRGVAARTGVYDRPWLRPRTRPISGNRYPEFCARARDPRAGRRAPLAPDAGFANISGAIAARAVGRLAA